jgi:hypothetical protein
MFLELLIRDGNKTILGSGHHHKIRESSLNQGKIPFLYARIRRSGDKSPPTARSPSEFAMETGGNSSLSVRKYKGELCFFNF